MYRSSEMQKQIYTDRNENYLQNNENNSNQNCCININQLITQPYTQNQFSASYILSSLYALSTYLFNKKIRQNYNFDTTIKNENINFIQYLREVEQEYSIYGQRSKHKHELLLHQLEQQQYIVINNKKNFQDTNINHTNNIANNKNNKQIGELLRCYQMVPYIYFQEVFALNFSILQQYYDQFKKSPEQQKQKIIIEQQKLNDCLDLVEINLFVQIHRKFEQYFTVVANFDYLRQSINQQLKKITTSKSKIKMVKIQFVDTCRKLKNKIIQKQNLEKIIKLIKIMKSLKKLPIIIDSILQSSLPYECLQLLQNIRLSIQQVNEVHCISEITKNLKQSETLVQIGLTKRYNDELYLYLQQCCLDENISLFEEWGKISSNNILDKDSSIMLNQNDSVMSNKSGFLLLEEDLSIFKQGNIQLNNINTNMYCGRQESKEYEISMILLQSYQYIDFSIDSNKNKICNALKIYIKKFQRSLATYLKNIVQQQKQEIMNKLKQKQKQKQKQNVQKQKQQKPQATKLTQNQNQNQKQRQQQLQKQKLKLKQIQKNKIQTKCDMNGEEQLVLTQDLIEQISVQFYIKHIKLLNHIFKSILNRNLGYLHTLLSEYEQQLGKQIQDVVNKNNYMKIKTNFIRFRTVFQNQILFLPSIFKIIKDRIKYFLTLKNIRGISARQFVIWACTFKFWQNYLDYIIQQHPLLNYTPTMVDIIQNQQGQQLCISIMNELLQIIRISTQKFLKTMSLNNLLQDLTMNYLQAYHESLIENTLIASFAQQSWQSVQIPNEFSDVLSQILNFGRQQSNNISLTILDNSASQLSNNIEDNNNSTVNKSFSKLNFKILKNNIMIDGVRYKITISFLHLCEFIIEYEKMSRMFPQLLSGDSQSIRKILVQIYQMIYELIQKYKKMARAEILQAEALKMQKFRKKGIKNITVRFICLLSNCLSLLVQIVKQIPNKYFLQKYCIKSDQDKLIQSLKETKQLLLNKLSNILKNKIENIINNYLLQQKNCNNAIGLIIQTNNSISMVMNQMLEIIDEYHQNQICRQIVKATFQIFLQKYYTQLLTKMPQTKNQILTLIQKLRFLKKYFSVQFDNMIRDI